MTPFSQLRKIKINKIINGCLLILFKLKEKYDLYKLQKNNSL